MNRDGGFSIEETIRNITSLKQNAVLFFIQLLTCVRLFATPWTVTRQASLPMGILQARILEQVAMPFLRGLSQPRDRTQVSPDSLPSEPSGKPMNTGVGSLSLLQGNFPTQKSNQGLLHCRWILYQLSYQGSPRGEYTTHNYVTSA